MVVTLKIPYSDQVGYMFENFQIIWNYTTNRKKIVSRKMERMIKNTKLLRNFFMEVKNANPNG